MFRALFFCWYLFCCLIQVGLSYVCIGNAGDGKFKFPEYDPANEICCGGTIRQRTANLECCNAELYYSDKSICCNGQISDKTVSRSTMKWKEECKQNKSDCIDMMCCGNKLLPKEDNVVCCNGTKITLTEDKVENREFLLCCGKSVYNPQSQICCDGVFLRSENLGCCNGEIFNKRKDICIRGRKLSRTEGLCGDDTYNKMKDTCCEGKLTKNVPEMIKYASDALEDNPDAECCGSSIINSDKTCCEERHYGYPTHSIPKDYDLKCCGSGHYNQSRQFCVAGKPVDKSAHQAQCGTVLIDTRSQSCCANKQPYNISSQQCCEGANYCVIRKDEKCCNGVLMKHNELCCENIKPCKKRYMEDDECCYDYERNNGQTYRSGESTCNRGELFFVPDGSLLCGKELYSADTHFCCSEKKYKHGSGQCCKGVYSNIPQSEGRCCIEDNKAYRFNDTANPCIKECNKKKYDESYELCCDGWIYKYTGNNFCCGAYAINPDKMRCCGDLFPYRPGSRKECCHNTQLYNKRYSTCKDDGKVESDGVLKGLSDVQKMCHPLAAKVFDGGIQQVCMRNHAISGRISSIQKFTGLISISLRGVKPIKTGTGNFQKRINFKVHIGGGECSIDHFKHSRVMVFFDGELKNGKFVEIFEDSHFFIHFKTSRRYYSVKETLSTHLCKTFSYGQ